MKFRSSAQLKRLSPVALAVAVVAVVGVVYVLAVVGDGGRIDISPSGVSVEVTQESALAGVLDQSLQVDSAATEAILESRGFYRLSSDGLWSELANIDPMSSDGEVITLRLGRMLANLEGPFQLPGTLQHADEKLIQALHELDKAMVGDQEANALVVSLWEQILDQRGAFRQRAFPADIRIVGETSNLGGMVFACPGGSLVSGRIVDVFTEYGTSIRGEIAHDPALFHCETPAATARRMLTGNVAIPLGVSRLAYSRLYPTTLVDDSQTGEVQTGAARFVVYPRNMVSIPPTMRQ